MVGGDVTGLNAGTLAAANALIINLPSGDYGFWTGTGNLTVNGIDCVGSGSLLEVISFAGNLGIDATQIKVRLRAIPDTDLTPDILATIEAEAYKNAPVSIYLLVFTPQTGALLRSYRQWRGFIDTITHEATVHGEYALLANLESKALDHARAGVRSRTDADQRLLDPNDGGLKNVAVVGEQTIFFGRKTPASARKSA
jgi:hypothetical protein